MHAALATRLLSATALALASAGVARAEGSRLFDPSISTCTTADCSSVLLNGTTGNIANNADPWTIGLYARAGECLRIRTLSQTADLENVTVAPSGTVFRNDDGGLAPCTLCSLVKFVAPNTGWYTVAINQFTGAATSADFQIAYGRYTGTNPNCAAPTPPAAPAAAAAAKASGSNAAPSGSLPTAN
jgi:hypothetical protein